MDSNNFVSFKYELNKLVSVNADRPHHHIFYLRCPDAMAAHVDDVVQAASDLVVAFLGAIGAVASEEVT